MLKQELKTQINKLWDKFWSGGISNPLTAIEQMSYLIFMKRIEDLDNRNKDLAKARGEKYKSVFEDYNECKWSHWKHFSAEDMLRHVRDAVFPFIKNVRRGEDTLFAESMKDAVFLIPKASLLQEAVSIIDAINLSAQNQDVQGDIYEYLLNELKTSGKNGQFRTPRHIIRMIVSLTNPKLGEKICDPACGTAGFLINSYEHILKQKTSPEMIEYDEEGIAHNLVGDKIADKKKWNLLRRETFYGYDNDPTMVRLALMNMILHGIEHPNIKYSDGLSKRFDQKEEYDVILANPPFTGSIDISDINDNFKIKTTKTELLFLELFYNLLHRGGRGGVVVPNGVLFGSSNAHKNIRKILLEKCQLEAVISLPSGVFQPYSGVGTAVLIFTKGGNTNKVWFYEMKKDGFSLDQKRDFIDGKGDIPDIIEKFKTKEESEQSFNVEFSLIKENEYSLDINRYKKFEHKEVKHDKPTKIIDEIIKEEETILKELSELRKKVGG
jgi:type I restriction enzyme M protein